MRKIIWWNMALLLFLFAAAWAPATARGETNPFRSLKDANYRKVVQDIASQVVAALPDDIHFRLLGICPIEGDEGALVDALTTTIKSETRYHLIERKDLNKLLTEQGVQLSPISDPRAPVEPGKIKGVEGLLLGKVVKKNCSFLFCTMDVFIKLDDVEGGDVKFARNFSGHFLPRTTLYGVAAIVLLILILLYANHRKKQKFASNVRTVRQDSDMQQNIQNELKKARDDLNQAHDDLVAANKTDLSVQVREAREEINALLFKVEQDPGLHLNAVEKGTQGEIKSLGKSMIGLTKNVLAESEKVLRTTRSANDRGVESAVADLKKELKNASNRYYDRKVGKA